jgi:hypothetical protein
MKSYDVIGAFFQKYYSGKPFGSVEGFEGILNINEDKTIVAKFSDRFGNSNVYGEVGPKGTMGLRKHYFENSGKESKYVIFDYLFRDIGPFHFGRFVDHEFEDGTRGQAFLRLISRGDIKIPLDPKKNLDPMFEKASFEYLKSKEELRIIVDKTKKIYQRIEKGLENSFEEIDNLARELIEKA